MLVTRAYTVHYLQWSVVTMPSCCCCCCCCRCNLRVICEMTVSVSDATASTGTYVEWPVAAGSRLGGSRYDARAYGRHFLSCRGLSCGALCTRRNIAATRRDDEPWDPLTRPGLTGDVAVITIPRKCTASFVLVVHCPAVLVSRTTRRARPSVRPSVRPSRAGFRLENEKAVVRWIKDVWKTDTGVNVPWARV